MVKLDFLALYASLLAVRLELRGTETEQMLVWWCAVGLRCWLLAGSNICILIARNRTRVDVLCTPDTVKCILAYSATLQLGRQHEAATDTPSYLSSRTVVYPSVCFSGF